MKSISSLFVFAPALLLLVACGGGGGGGGATQPPAPPPVAGPPPPDPVTISTEEAFRFLNQSTFGATLNEAERVKELGFEEWIEDQKLRPASLQLPHLLSLPPPQNAGQFQAERINIALQNVIAGPDQLRQRVAFALSQIMVVSQFSALNNRPYGLADYYDVLVRNAFGNYRTLLEEVTLHPAMGEFLSMLGNRKPDPENNIRPDENYAREALQLFSVGLVELNPDGSLVLDTAGQAVPTFGQDVIEGFAHVYTGWHFAGARDFLRARPTIENQTQPMQLYADFHDEGEKRLLGGEVIAAGQGGEADLAQALDNIFNHPNVAPFITYRLIQRLVTSNPTPGYVGRISSIFDDNGEGVRGDLGAVVTAILLDPEARASEPDETAGKLKEPILRYTQLFRAYDARSQSGRWPFVNAHAAIGQGILQAPSVFNFFSPFFAPPGELESRGLVAPELQIATEFLNTTITNVFYVQAFARNSENLADLGEDDVYIEISDEMAVADDVGALIALVADKLLAGELSSTLESGIRQVLAQTSEAQRELRVAETIYQITASPEYALQR